MVKKRMTLLNMRKLRTSRITLSLSMDKTDYYNKSNMSYCMTFLNMGNTISSHIRIVTRQDRITLLEKKEWYIFSTRYANKGRVGQTELSVQCVWRRCSCMGARM
ncbi:hypothetical protein Salmi_Mp019 (mitochondrion) [Salvia miltiorrhiza]|uniref:Uncharacterized protein n=1 Tax=Salvia miltiorrhiza TaxID=226208 RepID=V9P589_SALMI|nr:hypothetical protein Salmi_Mp019 [Salvia miltiorrhiza]AGU16553.1 hypothetical protein Salmi_Mp019 [Salvia miltiorrhiza]